MARRDSLRRTHARWEIGRLEELARTGSLAAGRELMHRVITQSDRASSRYPDVFEPVLHRWLRDVLRNAIENPRQSIGQLMAPRKANPRPINHAELIRALSLSQEAYYRVRKAVEAGAPINPTFAAVADELNGLGYRNSSNGLLRASSIRRRYYAVRSQEKARSQKPKDMPKDMDRRLRKQTPETAA
jgi:hypothetical protein